jgi:2-haloacid dehalogenase
MSSKSSTIAGFDRRSFIKATSLAGLAPLARSAMSYAAAAPASDAAAVPTPSATPFKADQIKAIMFDIQGSTVDFYSTIVQKGEKFTTARGIHADWTKISNQWRTGYRQQLDQVIAGTIPWRSTDVIYRDALDQLLATYDWGQKLTAIERDQLNGLWSVLEPWPDTRPGLERLRRKYTLSTLSNGSMASVVSIAKHGHLPFDCVLTAELVRSSKPDPKVYALAANSFNLAPDQILMFACHKYDLAAAKKFGFRVAFVPRPLEFGPNGKVDLTREDYFDLMPSGLTDLARMMGT